MPTLYLYMFSQLTAACMYRASKDAKRRRERAGFYSLSFKLHGDNSTASELPFAKEKGQITIDQLFSAAQAISLGVGRRELVWAPDRSQQLWEAVQFPEIRRTLISS